MITDEEMEKLLATLSDVAFDMIKEFNKEKPFDDKVVSVCIRVKDTTVR